MASEYLLEMSEDMLKSFNDDVMAESTSIIAMNAAQKIDPYELCINRKVVAESNHIFQHKVSEIKPVTNQKSSGRCWSFAALNVMRLPFVKTLNIEEFEFSQAHIFFWDKIERSNFFLNTIVECFKKGEEVDGRLISYLLQKPVNDGGQWDMFVNLVKRYGLMPKQCFPESYSTTSSGRMNQILNCKLKEYTRDIKVLFDKKADDAELTKLLTKQMKEIYRIVSICLGVPPKKFSWEYYDKSKNYQCISDVTPLQFYEEHVKPAIDLEDMVCLVSDPRETNPYERTYTVDCLGNMVGGKKTVYNNQQIEILMKAAVDSIKEGDAIWFGCDVFKRFHKKTGFQGIDVLNTVPTFQTEIGLGLSKAERLIYGESSMSHAMGFTGVTVDEDGKAVKFRVENSWGEDHGEKGYLVLSYEWFKEFVFEIVVNKKYLSQKVLDVMDEKPIVLPAWDPMGSLAS